MSENQQEKPSYAQQSTTDQKMVILSIALSILSMRLLIILSLLLNTGVFIWALTQDNPKNYARLAGATIFAIANWCLVKLNPQETKHGS